MAKRTVEREQIICDLGDCEHEAVSTCQSCNLDWCAGHGGVFEGQVSKPQIVEPEAGQPRVNSKIRWVQETAFKIEACNPCLSRLRALLTRKKFSHQDTVADGPGRPGRDVHVLR